MPTSKKIELPKNEVLKLIDFEIERIEASTNWTGRNTWILLGSLVAALGLLLTEIETAKLSRDNILYLSLCWVVLYDLLTIASWFLTPRHKYTSHPRLFTTRMYASPSREGFLLVALRCIALIIIACLLRYQIEFPIVFYFFYGIFLLVTLNALQASVLDLPISPNQSNNRITFMNLMLFTLGTIGAIDLISNWAAGSFIPTIKDIRVSGMIFVIVLTLLLLAQQKSHAVIYDVFKNVRRDIGLGLIEDKTAYSKTKALIIGMTPKEALENDMGLAISSAKALKSFWKENRKNDLRTEEKWQRKIRVLLNNLKRELSVTKPFIMQLIKTEQKIKAMTRISPEIAIETNEVSTEFLKEIDGIFSKVEKEKYPLNILIPQLEKLRLRQK